MPDPTVAELAPSLQPITAAVLSAGALLIAALRVKNNTVKSTQAPGCACKEEILQSEERIKKHVDSMQIQIRAQLEATHRHAGLIPEVKESVAVLVALSQRGDRR